MRLMIIDRDEVRSKQNKKFRTAVFQPSLPCARLQTALCDALREVKRSLFFGCWVGFCWREQYNILVLVTENEVG